MAYPTPSQILDGTELVLAAAAVSPIDAVFGAPADGWGGDRDDARVFYVVPRYDKRSEGSGCHRELALDIGITYPRNKTSRAVMVNDAVVFERTLRDLPDLLAALPIPVTGTRLAKGGSRSVSDPEFDFVAAPHKATLTFAVRIEYHVDLTP